MEKKAEFDQMSDEIILAQYKELVPFLAATLGPDFEVALSKVSDNALTIIAIENGHVTGRSASLTTVGMSFDSIDPSLKYSSNTYKIPSGKDIKSNSFYIRNERHQIIGILSINYSISEFMRIKKKLDFFVGAAENSASSPQNLHEFIINSIESIIWDLNYGGVTLTRKHIINILKVLHERKIDVSIEAKKIIASFFGISIPTLYRYINQIDKPDPEHS